MSIRELLFCAVLVYAPAMRAQTFDVASVKPSAPNGGISCSGGPGTDAPAVWRCTNFPLSLLIVKAFGFQSFEFSPRDVCCSGRFDFEARIPEGTNGRQFHEMLRNLLRERFGLGFHFEPKDMPVYELTVAPNGPKLKSSERGSGDGGDEVWWVPPSYTVDSEGNPVFAEGSTGLATGDGGRNHWLAYHVSTGGIAKMLGGQLGRPVVDATGLQGAYDVDLKWVVQPEWELNETLKEEIRAQAGELPKTGSRPSLSAALRSQLGLSLKSARGKGRVVVIDFVAKSPTAN